MSLAANREALSKGGWVLHSGDAVQQIKGQSPGHGINVGSWAITDCSNRLGTVEEKILDDLAALFARFLIKGAPAANHYHR